MINNFAILVSICGIAYTIMRAMVLDKTVPWFGRKRGPAQMTPMAASAPMPTAPNPPMLHPSQKAPTTPVAPKGRRI